jgi:hypothetical protein
MARILLRMPNIHIRQEKSASTVQEDSPDPPVQSDDSSHEFKDPSKKKRGKKAKKTGDTETEDLTQGQDDDDEDDENNTTREALEHTCDPCRVQGHRMEPCVFNPEHSAGSSRGGTCMMAGMRTRRTTSGEEIFLIDSGASHHTVQTTKKFEKYAIQNTDNNIRVKTASGH